MKIANMSPDLMVSTGSGRTSSREHLGSVLPKHRTIDRASLPLMGVSTVTVPLWGKLPRTTSSRSSDLYGGFSNRFYKFGTKQITVVRMSADPIGAPKPTGCPIDLALGVPVGSHRDILDESEREHQRACQ